MEKKLVLLRDSHSLLEVPESVARLRAHGLEPVTRVDGDDQRRHVVALVAGLGHFGPTEAQALPNLKTVARFGAGFDNVDVKALASRGISVSYTPDVSTADVAEFAFALLILVLRGAARDSAGLKSESECWRVIGRGLQLADATVGIIGCGRIGLHAARLIAPLAKHTLLWNRSRKSVDLPAVDRKRYSVTSDLDEIATRCDGVSVHLALSPETRGLIGESFFAAVEDAKRSIALVNTARGDVVDEAALLKALNRGTVRDSAVDVWSTEGAESSELVRRLRRHPSMLPTSHIGAFTLGVQRRCALQCVNNLIGALGYTTDLPVFIARTGDAA